jgi:hypothetical protein
MAAHEAVSAGILTSSLVLIAFVAMFIVIGNKDKNDRYVSQGSQGSQGSQRYSSIMEDVAEGLNISKRHRRHKNKRKSHKKH